MKILYFLLVTHLSFHLSLSFLHARTSIPFHARIIHSPLLTSHSALHSRTRRETPFPPPPSPLKTKSHIPTIKRPLKNNSTHMKAYQVFLQRSKRATVLEYLQDCFVSRRIGLMYHKQRMKERRGGGGGGKKEKRKERGGGLMMKHVAFTNTTCISGNFRERARLCVVYCIVFFCIIRCSIVCTHGIMILIMVEYSACSVHQVHQTGQRRRRRSRRKSRNRKHECGCRV